MSTAAIVANLGFETIGLDLLVVAGVAALAVSRWYGPTRHISRKNAAPGDAYVDIPMSVTTGGRQK